MDLTPLEHLLIALACMSAIGYFTGNWWAGACLGIGLFIGREHAQAEYRYIEHYGQHLRANLPWWGAFDVRVWDFGSLLDWFVPSVGSVVLAWFGNRWQRTE